MNNSQMINLSHWASKNVIPARTILVINHIMLIILALSIGKFLNNLSITLQPAYLLASATLFIAAYLGYPKKNKKLAFNTRYRNQKIFDGLLALSTFLMILCLSNNSLSPLPSANASFPKRISTIETKYNKPNITIPHAKIINKKTERKQLTTSMLKFLNISKQYSSSEKVIITILAIIGAAGLLYLLAALACTISCNGAEGAAILVGVVGTAAIIFLFVKLMKHLNRNPSISRKNKPSSTIGE